MRLAILHDYLNQFGGAERVLQSLLELFPEAHLYTLLYDEEKTGGLFRGRVTKTSFLDLPLVRNKHRLFIPLMPAAAKWLNGLEDYDLVISSTAGYAKGIGVNAPYHISYCHSPLRYAWEVDYLKNLPFAPWPLKEVIVRPVARWLRDWDKSSSGRVNLFVANSNFIAQKIKNYYGRDSEIIYPPIDVKLFYPEPISTKKDYYLMVGRLLYYKGFDLGVEAFNRLKKPLKIVGAGPEVRKLKQLARSTLIEFLPPVSDGHLRILYSNAKALIFPQIEDFGLVAAEAQACGLPVLAYGKGGAVEIVKNGETGLFFREQTPEGIVESVLEAEHTKFDRNAIANSAQRFSKREFKKKFVSLIANLGFPIAV